MRAAVLDAAQFGKASGMAALIVRAREINRMLGTNLAPWELESLPDEWVTALEVWAEDYPKAKAWMAEADQALARLRSKRKQ